MGDDVDLESKVMTKSCGGLVGKIRHPNHHGSRCKLTAGRSTHRDMEHIHVAQVQKNSVLRRRGKDSLRFQVKTIRHIVTPPPPEKMPICSF